MAVALKAWKKAIAIHDQQLTSSLREATLKNYLVSGNPTMSLQRESVVERNSTTPPIKIDHAFLICHLLCIEMHALNH